MDYDSLSKEEVMYRLTNHDETEWNDRLWNEVIDPADVLYYLDTFGDLTLAINCQGLPKDLPDRVIIGVHDAGHDVLNDLGRDIDVHQCPICNRELYEFPSKGANVIIDEYGDDHTKWIELIGDPSGRYWDTSGEHQYMCVACYQHPRESFGLHATYNGVKVFYGDDDSWYGFRTSGTVVNHDSWGADDPSQSPRNLRDKNDNLVRSGEVEKAFAGSESDLNEFLNKMDWIKITPTDVRVSTPGMRRPKRYAKEIIESWAEAPYDIEGWLNSHPDMNFTYIIQNGRNIYCHKDNREDVLYHLEDQVLSNSNQIEKLKEH